MALLFGILLAALFIGLQGILFEIKDWRKVHLSAQLDCIRMQPGDTSLLSLTLDNRQWFFLPWIRINIQFPAFLSIPEMESSITESYGIKTIVLSASLFSFQKLRQQIPFQSSKRGYAEIQVTVELLDFFKNKSSALPPLVLKLIVHPQPLCLDSITEQFHNPEGLHPVRRWLNPDPLFFSDVRPYLPQDSMKDIDWRASSRMNELYVKKYDVLADPAYALFLLAYPNASLFSEEEEFFEKAVSYCTLLIHSCVKRKVRVSFKTNAVVKGGVADTSFAEYNANHQIACLDMLACSVPYLHQEPTIFLKKQCHGSLEQKIVFIANSLSEELIETAVFLAHIRQPYCFVLNSSANADQLPRGTEIILLPKNQEAKA